MLQFFEKYWISKLGEWIIGVRRLLWKIILIRGENMKRENA